ncbi:MAG: high frequency lysogenization protein HflD [Thiotrichaceae bacterium]|nr:high frequency lysogenization protein HflD [Thiotrichaceae bacterium]
MEKNIYNRTIALSALFQCAEGVRQLAHTGKVDSELYRTALYSLCTENNDEILDIFEGLNHLNKGFRVLTFQLGGEGLSPSGDKKNLEVTRYCINLLHLQKKLQANPSLFQKIIDGITDVQRQLNHFKLEDTTITDRLADIYSQTVSTIGPKIIVNGNQDYLAVKSNAAKIRTLLLAGIRATLLWQQAGGNRWKLLLERKKMQNQAHEFIKKNRSI